MKRVRLRGCRGKQERVLQIHLIEFCVCALVPTPERGDKSDYDTVSSARVALATGCQCCEATRGRERKIRGYQLNAIFPKPAQDRRFMIDFLSVDANYVTYLLGLRPTGNRLPVPPARPPRDIATQSLERGNGIWSVGTKAKRFNPRRRRGHIETKNHFSALSLCPLWRVDFR